ncbi:hypothetical protein R1flu_025686 [Riccia fluitans]|uniref:Uncharacterized protein n=1 Tax=Riccia fluitans TaxID=41844 RepID=A0ABD1XYW6_9MARC
MRSPGERTWTWRNQTADFPRSTLGRSASDGGRLVPDHYLSRTCNCSLIRHPYILCLLAGIISWHPSLQPLPLLQQSTVPFFSENTGLHFG